MISDDQLYQLAIFLGSCSMLLIVLYHYLEVNAEDSSSAVSMSSANSPSVQSRTSPGSSKHSGSPTSIRQDAVGGGLSGRKG
ncbi:hypothetical protein AJ78_08204 [Emergomyces pasteurianus Ep9510]|uniref:Dolichyl-diphosphooligosaccharide--protein glycosyltransferase subunit 4 n=1 Tax=Emergomyces pasteurianus Ep9510 TaxID=1447872 RepID=A0A1J9Q4R0_9EURO|nr:hypothetical protein AJ78_08204 [Emergomyces pasteurianus Ep9510]